MIYKALHDMASASLINLGLYHTLPCLYFSPLTLNVLLFPEHTKNPTIREPSDLLYSLHKILFNRAFTGLLHSFIESLFKCHILINFFTDHSNRKSFHLHYLIFLHSAFQCLKLWHIFICFLYCLPP